MKKIIWIFILILILAGGWYLYSLYRKNQQEKIISNLQTVPVERGNLIATVGGTGTVRANQTAILTWQTSGVVAQVMVKVGDRVTSGQVLASLETTSLPQNVILSQADLMNAKKTLEDLYTNADIAKTNAMRDIAKYAQAVRDAQYKLDNFTIPTNQMNLNAIEALDLMQERLDRARQEFEPYKYYAVDHPKREELKQALDEAQSDYNAAVRRLDYEYELEVAKANLEKARQDYETWKDGPDPDEVAAVEARIAAAQATLDLAQIKAPFAGTITDVQIKVGDQVSPGNVAFRVDDLSHMLVDVQISEVDINNVQVDQEVNLTFDAILNKEYHGLVIEVARVGVVNQGLVNFTVTVELTDTDQGVKPAMTAAVNIIVNQLTDVLLVPNRAVRILEGKRVVYILQSKNPQPVEITLGASSDTVSEVLEGNLKVGDLIVLNPPTVFEQTGHPPWMQR